MGSTGSGSFSDYPGTGDGESKGGGGAGGGGEPTPEDRCNRAFGVSLEDVEHSEYYASASAVPAVGTQLRLEHRNRLVAVDASGASVGSLPTSYNYLADCLASGFTYTGRVSASSAGPNATLRVDFAPDQ